MSKILDHQHLYLIKSYCCSSWTGFKSVFFFFFSSFQSFCIFVLLMFAFKVFSEVGEIYFFSIYNCRKDTYGVFSEPVDLNEVSVLMMHLAFWTCLYAFVI
ncbi:hypothetical protein NC653_012088 [Populus alba x Populus x berolinensis]|uniref:Uncharacterized protein n=1 Tax=Populus alba x Populus x berolinensis TaxID=444605 RepID=A0AAD6R521_9ROSI|nr:hypothetical protein NC653_012088 [Populus alba x Populus x berolinensis]